MSGIEVNVMVVMDNSWGIDVGLVVTSRVVTRAEPRLLCQADLPSQGSPNRPGQTWPPAAQADGVRIMIVTASIIELNAR